MLIDPLDLWIVDDVEVDVVEGPAGTWKPTNPASVSQLDIDDLESYLIAADVTLSTIGTSDDDPAQHGDVIFDADRYLHTEIGVDNSLFVYAYRNIEFTANDGINFEGNGHVELYAGLEEYGGSGAGSVTSVDRTVPNISTIKGDIIIDAGSGGINVGFCRQQ